MEKDIKPNIVSEIVGKIVVDTGHVILVRIEEFKGKYYIDVRKHFKDNWNVWGLSKKGIRMSLGQVQEIIKFLEIAEKRVNELNGFADGEPIK